MLTQIRSEMGLAGSGKLADLRAKTDRDLALLLGHAIERGFQAVTESRFTEAEEAYVRAARVLPMIKGLSSREFASLETRLHALRAHLDSCAYHACLASQRTSPGLQRTWAVTK